jgi:hypothetical protein
LDVGDLARCALTCRTWQEVAVTASLHHNLRFSPFRQAYVPQTVNVFCTCLIMRQPSSFLLFLRLAIPHCRVTNDVLFSLTHRYRPFIEKINLRGCAHLTGDILPVIAQCANLSTLVLADCPLLRVRRSSLSLAACLSPSEFGPVMIRVVYCGCGHSPSISTTSMYLLCVEQRVSGVAVWVYEPQRLGYF